VPGTSSPIPQAIRAKRGAEQSLDCKPRANPVNGVTGEQPGDRSTSEFQRDIMPADHSRVEVRACRSGVVTALGGGVRADMMPVNSTLALYQVTKIRENECV